MESSTDESTTAHQPGKSWIVLEEDDGNGFGLPLLMATGPLLKEWKKKTFEILKKYLFPNLAKACHVIKK